MANIEITRTIEIDAGHRILHHGGKCRGLHGHRYKIEATASGPLQEEGVESDMVMDFGNLKQVMMEEIHDVFDHALILEAEDPLISALGWHTHVCKPAAFKGVFVCDGDGFNHSTRICVTHFAPTAERLAQVWYNMIRAKIPQLIRVRVWETPNCMAEYAPGA